MKKLSMLIALILISSVAHAELIQGQGKKEVTTAGTAEALSATATSFSSLSVCAESNNTGVIAVGGAGVIASLSTRTGIYLDAGDCYSIDLSSGKLGNLNTIYLDTTVSTDGVNYHYYQEV